MHVWAWARPHGPCRLTLLSSPSYEVQLESKVRRKGLGKFLIQILQLMANRWGVCVCVCLPLLGGAASAVRLGGGRWGQGSQECSGRRVSRTSLPCHDSTFGAVG